MTSRYRSLDTRSPLPGRLFYVTWRYSSQSIGSVKYCWDEVGDFEDVNPLRLDHWTKVTPALEGVLYGSSGQVTRKFENYPPGYWTTAIPDPSTGHPSLTTADLEAYAWEILARTNPSRPYINLPQQIGELRDLPAIVKGWGVNMLEEAAKGVITWQFAIRPMLSELGKLFDFHDAVNRRMFELNTLRAKRVLRKRCKLVSSQNASAPYRVLLHSEGASVYAWRTNVYRRQLWGTAQYRTEPGSYLNDMLDPKSSLAKSADFRAQVKDMLLGCTARGAAQAAWELVPWSWLADWFGNAGTMLAATNNTVGVTSQNLALMCTTSTEVRFEVRPADIPSWLHLNGAFDWKCVRKERFPVAPVVPFPLISLPILSGGQWSILGSLAVLKSGFATRWYRMDPKLPG